MVRTPLLTNSEVAAYKEFENAPKSITEQYPLTNISEFLKVMHAVEEDPKAVVHTIESLLQQDKPILMNPSGLQAHVIR
jgi:hypothetical protein